MKLTDAEKTCLLAEGVMGWWSCDPSAVCMIREQWMNQDGEPQHFVEDWQPLTNESHAAEVRERRRARGWWWSIETFPKYDRVKVAKETEGCSYSARVECGAIPRGICHAALLALRLATEEEL